MNDINLSPYSAEQADIQRRQRLAEMMQQQAMEPLQAPPNTAQGWAVQTSPYSVLAKMLQGYAGGKGQADALSKQNALAARLRGDRAADLSDIMGSMKGSPAMPEQFTGEAGTMDEMYRPAQEATQAGQINPAIVAQLRTPEAQAAAMQMFQKQNEPFTLAGDAKRFGPGGAVTATNPKPIAPVVPKEHVIGGNVYRSGPGGVQNLGGPGAPVDYNKPFMPDGSPNPAYQAYALKKSKAGASNQNVVVAQEKAFEGELGKEQAKGLIEGRKAADDAAQIINTVNIGRSILKKGMVTGFGANAIVGIGQALKQAGVDFGGDATANAQAYTAAMAGNVGKIIKQFGSGTGLSDADREYATKMAGGLITLDQKAIEKILDINERAARNVLKLHNRRAEGVKSNIPLQVDEPPEVTQQASGGLTPAEQQELQQLRQRYGNGRR